MAYTKTVWENAPSTNTPINATRLNNLEDGVEAISQYITATATTNGDYKINISSNFTLAAGLKLNISFPAATTGTSNARLSIDGGTTYKNVFNGVQVLAKVIELKYLKLYYDGTQWQIDKGNNIITLELGSDQNQSSFSGGINVPMSLSSQIGNKLTFDSASGGVKIGAGVSKVKISQSMSSVHSVATITNSYVMKNGSVVGGSSNTTTASQRMQNIIPPKIISVSQNDILVGRIYVGASGNLTIRYNEGMTWLIVEVVE